MAESRNVVPEANAERNRTHGGYTFNAFPPDDYEGILLVVACVRLGDHAHLDVNSGRAGGVPGRPTTLHYGHAGHLILRWHEWLKFRELLDSAPWVRIAEVERPTDKQLEAHGAIQAPNPEPPAEPSETPSRGRNGRPSE